MSDAEVTFHADTLFSALCLEALHTKEGLSYLYDKCISGKIRFSDALPYIGNTLYLPKPLINMERDEDEERNSAIKKALKKLKYIPADKFEEYMEEKLQDVREILDDFKKLGECEIRTNVCVDREKDPEPYHVGVYRFQEKNGLYVCGIFASEEDASCFSRLLQAVGLSGIGGRRSSGLGKFQVEEIALEEIDVGNQFISRLSQKYEKYISLAASLPQDKELSKALEGSTYQLLKRSGFVYSTNYAETFQKKQTQYFFAPGSCFENQYKGDIYDVSGGGNHPVYRYGLPMFLGVK